MPHTHRTSSTQLHHCAHSTPTMKSAVPTCRTPSTCKQTKTIRAKQRAMCIRTALLYYPHSNHAISGPFLAVIAPGIHTKAMVSGKSGTRCQLQWHQQHAVAGLAQAQLGGQPQPPFTPSSELIHKATWAESSAQQSYTNRKQTGLTGAQITCKDQRRQSGLTQLDDMMADRAGGVI